MPALTVGYVSAYLNGVGCQTKKGGTAEFLSVLLYYIIVIQRGFFYGNGSNFCSTEKNDAGQMC